MNNEEKLIEKRINKYIDHEINNTHAYGAILPFMDSYALLLNTVDDIVLSYKDKYTTKNAIDNLSINPKYDTNELLDYANDFYGHLDMNINVYDMYKKGIIKIEKSQIKSECLSTKNIQSMCKKEKDDYKIYISNTGLLLDSSAIVHEISHYNDLKNNRIYTYTDLLLTEAIAITFELLFNRYEEKHLYKESKDVRDLRIASLLESEEKLKMVLPLIKLKNEQGDINLKTYKKIGGDKESYKILLNYFNKKGFYNSTNEAMYFMALCLTPVMYKSAIENEVMYDNIDFVFLKKSNNPYLDKLLKAEKGMDEQFLKTIQSNLIELLDRKDKPLNKVLKPTKY